MGDTTPLLSPIGPASPLLSAKGEDPIKPLPNTSGDPMTELVAMAVGTAAMGAETRGDPFIETPRVTIPVLRKPGAMTPVLKSPGANNPGFRRLVAWAAATTVRKRATCWWQ